LDKKRLWRVRHSLKRQGVKTNQWSTGALREGNIPASGMLKKRVKLERYMQCAPFCRFAYLFCFK
jgi:hypothetical protein